MNEAIDQLCKQLRLAHIAEGFEDIPFTSPDEFALQLLLKERDGREQSKVARNIKKARFLDYKVLGNYEWHSDICLPACLIHHAHIISYTGQSFRLANALSKKL